jgi:hypothetical protein
VITLCPSSAGQTQKAGRRHSLCHFPELPAIRAGISPQSLEVAQAPASTLPEKESNSKVFEVIFRNNKDANHIKIYSHCEIL